MAKFRVRLNVEVEGDDVDDAILKAAIHFAINSSAKRPILTVQPQDPYNFPAPRNYDPLAILQKTLFKKGDKVIVNMIDVMPTEAWPEPPGMQ